MSTGHLYLRDSTIVNLSTNELGLWKLSVKFKSWNLQRWVSDYIFTPKNELKKSHVVWIFENKKKYYLNLIFATLFLTLIFTNLKYTDVLNSKKLKE